LPRHLWEFQAFPAMPRQLGEYLNFFYKPSILGNCATTKKSTLKTKLGYTNLT
jgi:hypothetical protein